MLRIVFLGIFTCSGTISLTFLGEISIVDSHELIVSDDLDCHLLAGSGRVPGSDHITEHTLASVAIHIIAFVQRFPDVHP